MPSPNPRIPCLPRSNQSEDAALRARLSEALSEADASRLARQAAECVCDRAAGRIAALERREAGLREEVVRMQEAAAEAEAGAATLRERLEGAGRKLVWRQRLMAEVCLLWGLLGC